jgi:REP element-mobilizing transposase RayT
MARPLRIEFEGGVYHVTSRGDGREDIYLDDADRVMWLEVFGEVCKRFNWLCHAYCLMTNHYHILIETPDANLSRGMRHLNGVYTQRFNRKHGRVGHVFQGRFKAILVDKQAYLLELSRYVVLNPIRANMVKAITDWPWSSYLPMLGLALRPEWLNVAWLLSQFGTNAKSALPAYQAFVHAGIAQTGIWAQLRGQLYLGDDAFVNKMQSKLQTNAMSTEIPRQQRQGNLKTLADYKTDFSNNRDQGMALAYLQDGYSMQQVANFFQVHYATVSRAVRKFKG